MKSWLLGIVLTSLAAGLARQLAPKGREQAVVRLVGGLLMALAILRPLAGGAWEGLELRRQPEGIAGELELGDGGPRPARPGYGFLRDCGVCGRSGWCSRRLGRALFIAERQGGVRAPPEDS